jgi:lipopolysaccharide export system permease protein
MLIIHRYILRQFLRNLGICLTNAVLLFTVIDFFDRIDIIAGEDTSIGLTFLYFLLKVPTTIHLMLPVSTLVATLMTVGLLSKTSEITAVRAAGVPLVSLAHPLLIAGLALSFISLGFSEVIVPYCSRKSHEIYNIDIRKKHLKGLYSQGNVWWRSGDTFYTVSAFDSRSNSIIGLTSLQVNSNFDIIRRTDSAKANWLDSNLGWSMQEVKDLHFGQNQAISKNEYQSLPLPISQEPDFFYDRDLDVESMGYLSLKKYIKKLKGDGIPVQKYLSDLRAKLSFPFVNFICVLVSLPFALKSSRHGGMAVPFIAGVAIGLSYFFVHSLAIALGRAELLSPTLAAWTANLILGTVGLILNWGSEAP